MENDRSAIQYQEGQQFLFEGTLRTLPFTIVVASLLALYLYLNNGSEVYIILWLCCIFSIVVIRGLHCKFVIHNNRYNQAIKFHLKLFTMFTLITGTIWTSIYFLSIPYMDETPRYVIAVSFSGMMAGATTTLGIYYPAYYAYVLSMFVPVILHNYLLGDINHIIVATIFGMYLLGLIIITKTHRNILRNLFSITAQNKDLLDKFEVLSITDALTGLYNRRHFTEVTLSQYNRSKEQKQSFVLVSIDVDNFKSINDNFGHPFGDKFLIYTSDYLKSFLLPVNGVIFRLGGDEFAALIVNINEEDSKNLCYEIKSNYIKNPPFEYEPQDDRHKNVLDRVSLSIGVVYIPPDASTNMDQIIDRVDQLLYQAKQQGKNELKYTKVT